VSGGIKKDGLVLGLGIGLVLAELMRDPNSISPYLRGLIKEGSAGSTATSSKTTTKSEKGNDDA